MTKAALKQPPAIAYDTDLSLWAEQQASLMRLGRWQDIDAENVAEEVESVGSSQKSAIRSRLLVLVLHLLKWEFQPEKRKYGWRATIIEQRIQIEDVIETSPSLHTWPDHVLAKVYQNAVLKAADDTGMPEDAFPATCPYTIAQILDARFYPGTLEKDIV